MNLNFAVAIKNRNNDVALPKVHTRSQPRISSEAKFLNWKDPDLACAILHGSSFSDSIIDR